MACAIYYKKDTPAGKQLAQYLATNYTKISQLKRIVTHFVTRENELAMSKIGITSVPYMVDGKTRLSGVAQIIGYLQNLSADPYERMVSTEAEQGEDDDDALDQHKLQQKIANMQRRRPPQGPPAPGRAIPARPQISSDADFVNLAGVGDKIAHSEDDGNQILEDFMLQEAIAFGKKVGPPTRKHR